MFKMGSHDPFGYLKHKLWPKVKNRLNFFPCRWPPHIVGKLSTKATTFF
jgi:hypothetical protein